MAKSHSKLTVGEPFSAEKIKKYVRPGFICPTLFCKYEHVLYDMIFCTNKQTAECVHITP